MYNKSSERHAVVEPMLEGYKVWCGKLRNYDKCRKWQAPMTVSSKIYVISAKLVILRAKFDKNGDRADLIEFKVTRHLLVLNRYVGEVG